MKIFGGVSCLLQKLVLCFLSIEEKLLVKRNSEVKSGCSAAW